MGKTVWLMMFFLLLFNGAVQAEDLTFEKAEWIWGGGGDPAKSAPKGIWYFKKDFCFPAGSKPRQASIIITCDNLWTLWVNGRTVGENDTGTESWTRPRCIDVSRELLIEENSISVKAENTLPGPAGLIVKLQVAFENGKSYELKTDGSWTCSDKLVKDWNMTGFRGDWTNATVAGAYGCEPWGMVVAGRAGHPLSTGARRYEQQMVFEDPVFKAGAVFVQGFIPFTRHDANNYVQYINGTRAYFEMDSPTPAAIGTRLYSLIPLQATGRLTLLCDAGNGKIGSPGVSYDGKTVFFSLAKEGDAFFHVYSVSSDGTGLEQITSGPFHDYDPQELPDGRLIFSSTRIGCLEEYHAKMSSSLFTCNRDGTGIKPFTYHIVADREPRVTAGGTVVFIRSDNFLERSKVETHLHETRMDGTSGQVIIGPARKEIRLDRNVAAESNSKWLREYGAGSPAPLPDGRVAAISQKGVVTSAEPSGRKLADSSFLFDMSAVEDGRLLCSARDRRSVLMFDPQNGDIREIVNVGDLQLTELHSVVSLQERRKPPEVPSFIDPKKERELNKTGYLYCQNARNTQHRTADLKRIKSIRVYEGRPFTIEPTLSIYEHIGTVGVELGTVPLAEDGSFYVEVPADRPIAMQAVDAEGRPVINEMSWIYVRPGEHRSCVGCHAPVDAAPSMAALIAVRNRPLKMLGHGEAHRFRANNGANGGVLNLQLDKFREAAAITSAGSALVLTNDVASISRAGIARDRGLVPFLLQALESKVDEERCAAALSLAACGNRIAVDRLRNGLKDGHDIVATAKKAALEHLTGGNIDPAETWDSIEAKLVERFRSGDHQDVHLVAEAMGHVGGDLSCRVLREYLEKNPNGELRIMMAVMRSLGYLKDQSAVPLLRQILEANLTKSEGSGFHELGFTQKPVYLAATAAEALGRIGGVEAEQAVLAAFPGLLRFHEYVKRVAEHSWLQGTNCSVLHYRLIEALDRLGSRNTGPLVEKVVESLPGDKDRGILYELDNYESLSARVVGNSGRIDEVVKACLSVLSGEPGPDSSIKHAVCLSPHAEGHIRAYSAKARAAQVLSIVYPDGQDCRLIMDQVKAFRTAPDSEEKAFCLFYLIRLLGRLGQSEAAGLLIDIVVNDPKEAEYGMNTPPTHNVYKGWRPFHRPAAVWALGEMRREEAVQLLVAVLQDFDNITATREQAAVSLGKIGDTACVRELKTIGENYPEEMTRRAILTSIEKLEQRQKM